MSAIVLWLTFVLAAFQALKGITERTESDRLPIIFVYTVVPAVCQHGLPDYIKVSLEQAIYTQPDCNVIMASNYADCELISKTVAEIPGLKRIDTSLIQSATTRLFLNRSSNVFSSDYANELWLTSALRFFVLEDIMRTENYTEILHVEADNMLYGRISTILPILRESYPLAATPLTANMWMVTASVFWVSSLHQLSKFNEYMMELTINKNFIYDKYLFWIRRYACCKPGGIAPDENGNGIKPYAINEMSMLANYHRLYPETFRFLPVAPAFDGYIKRRPFSNVTHFAPGGSLVGPATGHGIWDANSWGQYIGGTSRKNGRDKGFIDTSHISGQAIILGGCRVSVQCGNQTISPYGFVPPVELRKEIVNTSNSGPTGCYTAPFVQCQNSTWTPLWNLHVHSKHTSVYKSVACDCP